MDDVDVFLEDNRYCKMLSHNPDPEEFPLYYKARKLEYILNPGDRLFIPAGWYHFFCSETVDEELGINLAVNFWYFSQNWNSDKWHPTDDNHYETEMTPKIERHDIPVEDVLDILRNKKHLRCLRSKTLVFPPYQKKMQYPKGYMNWEYMSLDELLETKNPQYYMLQNETCTSELSKFNTFNYPTDLQTTAIWLNFGQKAVSLMHYDNNDNLYCQMKGTRRVVLAHPSERDNLYAFNPLPLDIIRKLKDRDYKNDPIIGKRSNNIPKDLCESLEKSLGDQSHITIENEILTETFKKEYLLYADHLRQHGCDNIPLDPHETKFLVHRVHGEVGLSTHVPIYIFWTIGRGTVSIRGVPFETHTGQVTICPNTYTYPVRLSGKDVILVIPTKENSRE